MTVKDLKRLLEEYPDNMTVEEFDNLPVMITVGDVDFHYPDPDFSGYVIFGEACVDPEGLVPHPDGAEIPAFILVAPMDAMAIEN